MIYDPIGIGNLPLPQVAPDIKLEKKNDTEEPRAVEDSDQSDDAKLDIQRENVEKKSAVEERFKGDEIEPEVYSAKGILVRALSSEENPNQQKQPIISLIA